MKASNWISWPAVGGFEQVVFSLKYCGIDGLTADGHINSSFRLTSSSNACWSTFDVKYRSIQGCCGSSFLASGKWFHGVDTDWYVHEFQPGLYCSLSDYKRLLHISIRFKMFFSINNSRSVLPFEWPQKTGNLSHSVLCFLFVLNSSKSIMGLLQLVRSFCSQLF